MNCDTTPTTDALKNLLTQVFVEDWDKLVARAMRKVTDQNTAADVVQTAFTSTLLAIEKDYIDHCDRRKLGAYVGRVVDHAALDTGRRSKRKSAARTGLEYRFLSAVVSEYETGDRYEEAYHDLVKALSQLCPDDRLILTSIHFKRLSRLELSAITGLSTTTITKRHHNAKIRLAVELMRVEGTK